jgi:hypothetical protein
MVCFDQYFSNFRELGLVGREVTRMIIKVTRYTPPSASAPFGAIFSDQVAEPTAPRWVDDPHAFSLPRPLPFPPSQRESRAPERYQRSQQRWGGPRLPRFA